MEARYFSMPFRAHVLCGEFVAALTPPGSTGLTVTHYTYGYQVCSASGTCQIPVFS